MAVSLLDCEVADLCIGKPPLRPLSASTTIMDALSALKASDDSFFSVWSGDRSSENSGVGECRCVGKICMVDVVCHLCKPENLSCPSSAMDSPVSVLLLAKVPGQVRHVEPHLSLLEAIDLILQGAQNLVVPIKSNSRKILQKSSGHPTSHYGREFCWLTQEDIIRFLLSSIGIFSPIPALSINALGLISTNFTAVSFNSPASLALGAIFVSLADQTATAVLDNDGFFIGEISPFTLACCNDNEFVVAAAIMTLSAGDLLAFTGWGGPSEEIVKVMKARLKEMNPEEMWDSSDISSSATSSSSSSSDDESSSQNTPLPMPGRYSRSCSYSARAMRRADAIVCHPRSSVAAVMVQAVTHRVNYVWVTDEDRCLVGIVTFSNMLGVLYEHLRSMA